MKLLADVGRIADALERIAGALDPKRDRGVVALESTGEALERIAAVLESEKYGVTLPALRELGRELADAARREHEAGR